MCQEAVRKLCNPSESSHVRKVARLLARPLSAENRVESRRSRRYVVDGDADLRRLLIPRMTVYPHETADTLGDYVEARAQRIRPRLPEPGYGTIDDPVVKLSYGFVIHSKPTGDSRTEVLDDDVGVLRDP